MTQETQVSVTGFPPHQFANAYYSLQYNFCKTSHPMISAMQFNTYTDDASW